jgi:hypothetical protein
MHLPNNIRVMISIKLKQIIGVIVTASLVMMLSLSVSADGQDGDGGSNVPPPKGDQCVEDPEWMRTHHFETILDHRDKTVLKGIRTTKHSLKNCISCHITPNEQGEYARYSNSEEHFCASCHSYAAVNIDCFSCHADRPENAVREALRQQSAYNFEKDHGTMMSANDKILNAELLPSE